MTELINQIRWRPQIGDPSTMGWVTVAAYGFASLMCALAALRTGRSPGTARGSRPLWLLVALFMAFLCLNKQLDLQSLLTDIGRVLAWRQGWYEDRREFQKLFIIALLGFSMVSAAFLLLRYHTFWKRHFLLATGLVFLTTFIAVRAVSFHHFDAFLNWSAAGVRMNWLFELGGIALVGLAALFDYTTPLGLWRKPLVRGNPSANFGKLVGHFRKVKF